MRRSVLSPTVDAQVKRWIIICVARFAHLRKLAGLVLKSTFQSSVFLFRSHFPVLVHHWCVHSPPSRLIYHNSIREPQQDHMGISVDYQVPLGDTWHALVKRPWKLLIALFLYLIWGTGVFTIPHVEVATFMRADMIDKEGRFIPPPSGDQLNSREPHNCPDFEIMVVGGKLFIDCVD
jgi:hypothetical protein